MHLDPQPEVSPPPFADSFLGALRDIVGPQGLVTDATDLERYERDWRGNFPGRARAVVRPGSTEEVAAVVRLCAQEKVPVVPQGGNTGLAGGSSPNDTGREVVLSLTRMNRVRGVSLADHAMIVEAGCILQNVQEEAARHNRLFPLSLAAEGSATIGGNLASNAGGEQVLRYGNARDLTLGLEVVLPDGRIWHGLSPLRKDNTGYDLKHLFIGSEGTLGVITAASLKLFPLPRQQATAWLGLDTPQQAIDVLMLLRETLGDCVTSFELIGRKTLDQVLAHIEGTRAPLAEATPWSVLVEVSETARDAQLDERFESALGDAFERGLVRDVMIAQSSEQAHALWHIRDHVPEAQRRDGPSIKHDLSVPISQIPRFIEETGAALEAAFPGIRLITFGHVGDGNLHYNQSKPAAQSDADFRAQISRVHEIVHEQVATMNGSISAEHGIGRLKQDALMHYKSAVALDLMTRVKRAFDPDNLFNPGRLLPADTKVKETRMSVSVFDMLALQHLWSSDKLREIYAEEQRIQKWLDFEAALANAQASLGIIPKEAAQAIGENAKVEKIDIPLMASEVRRIKHSLVPMLKQLQHLAGKEGEWVHYGATTQDVIDTGTILQLKEAHQVFMQELRAIGRELARLAKDHRDTVMVGRTHGVQALPITFGHKCAIWLDEVSRHYQRMVECEPRVFVGMLIGAVGTQASLGPQAREVETRTLESLGLAVPTISWGPARDRVTEYANLLAMIGATMSKIGNELFNMQRNEFAEVEEQFSDGKLASSTMPHKRNPTAAENIAGLARALRYNAAMMTEAMVQEHERDGIAWKTEWKALPESCLISGALLQQTTKLLAGLRVDTDAMSQNLDKMRGYLLTERVMIELGERVGKQTAHHWLYEASMHGIANKLGFADAMRAHEDLAKVLDENDIVRLTDPAGYLGQTGASIDRTLAAQDAAGWMND